MFNPGQPEARLAPQTETQWLGGLSSEAFNAIVHLDRKLEGMLAILLRLKELREAPDSDPESSES